MPIKAASAFVAFSLGAYTFSDYVLWREFKFADRFSKSRVWMSCLQPYQIHLLNGTLLTYLLQSFFAQLH